jgi:hypothetical protein
MAKTAIYLPSHPYQRVVFHRLRVLFHTTPTSQVLKQYGCSVESRACPPTVDLQANQPLKIGFEMGDTNVIAIVNQQQRPKAVQRLSLECNHAGHGMLAVLIFWIVIVAAGVGTLAVYSQTPGPADAPPVMGGFGQRSASAKSHWSLIIGIHPKCPCTLATISELQRIMRQCAGTLSCSVVAFVPTNAPGNWTDTESVRQAREIPGVEVVNDVGGSKLTHLGIQTSGAAVLYDSTGTPRFHGGITPSRGHEGVNIGSETICALINGQQPFVADTPVFGCRITN